ncbi:hypothetical protein ACFODL_09995 [Phenylobacterium terrae]|uniref:DUF726 domain-containing protein n=1 Tax=Phenylobacterium terrae TaxID=2665495 RepID=A0ABW4MXL7_9CAUL
MAELAGLPYIKLRFDAAGKRLDPPGPIAPPGVTDLIVISHGWHQDADDAEGMYATILGHLQDAARESRLIEGRKLGVAGVYWPSDKFKPDLTLEKAPNIPPGAGAGTALSGGGQDIGPAELRELAAAVARLLGLPEEEFGDLAIQARHGAGNADALIATIRSRLPEPEAVDELTRDEHERLLRRDLPGRVLFEDVKSGGPSGGGTSLPGAQDVGDVAASQAPAVNILGGPFAVVAKLLNQAAYFELKRRAGTVGEALGDLIDADGLPGVQRLHLAGHSFGARLVTAATSRMQTARPHSLTLIQGAFSHNGLGVRIPKGRDTIDGTFRNVVAEKKAGRVVITHTWNDHAVGLAYALASRASNTVASGLMRVTDRFGGAKDLHGGIGANGALRLEDGEWKDWTYDGAAVPGLEAGLVHNLKCDFIAGHTEIAVPGVGRLLLAAMV